MSQHHNYAQQQGLKESLGGGKGGRSTDKGIKFTDARPGAADAA